ncbi:MAG TPA: hypothetical protein VFA15_04095, partial [Nitrososphaera sp.]|nr:hypothetical protein [Nitrososphaera sp.]
HQNGRVYVIWRRDRDGRRICRDCYEILLTREKAAGIVHEGTKKRIHRTISQMKEVLFVQPEHTIINQLDHLRHIGEKKQDPAPAAQYQTSDQLV